MKMTARVTWIKIPVEPLGSLSLAFRSSRMVKAALNSLFEFCCCVMVFPLVAWVEMPSPA